MEKEVIPWLQVSGLRTGELHGSLTQLQRFCNKCYRLEHPHCF